MRRSRVFTFWICSYRQQWIIRAHGAPAGWCLKNANGRPRVFGSPEAARQIADELNRNRAVPLWNDSPIPLCGTNY